MSPARYLAVQKRAHLRWIQWERASGSLGERARAVACRWWQRKGRALDRYWKADPDARRIAFRVIW